MSGIDPFNLSEAEFDAVMTEIDAELRRDDDRIVGRELRGWIRYSQKFKITLSLGDPLATRVIKWFEVLYGERLLLDADFGKSIAVIRGDVYRMMCFRFYGVMYVICSADVVGRRMRQVTPQGVERTVANMIDGNVEGLTPDLARRLSQLECAELLLRYRRAFRAFTSMEGALSARHGGSDAPYVKEAMDDLIDASESFLLRKPNYGQSNWSSLQATEKVIKSYILEKGGAHGKVHCLNELCDVAYQLALPHVDEALIDAIQCKADVRYESALVSKEKALAAYEAALIVCAVTASFIKRSTAEVSIRDINLRIGKSMTVDALMLGHQPPSPPSFVHPPDH
jgi:HEPN domain-containing protein